MSSVLPDIVQVKELYDSDRYMDAFDLTRDLWRQPRLIDELSDEQLVMAGRLAEKLGGGKYSRWLFRRAHELSPGNPVVRYFATPSRRSRGFGVYDTLRELDSEPELKTDNPGLQASWYAWCCVVWASFRDFERADGLIARANGIADGDVFEDSALSWILICEARLRLGQDRWSDALELAQKAAGLTPLNAGVAGVIAEAKSKQGCIDGAVEYLDALVDKAQSYHLLIIAVWYMCAFAERSSDSERERWGRRASGVADLLAALAPLADRDTVSQIARCRLVAANTLRNKEDVRKFASEVNSPFHHTVVDNMDRNPEGRRKVFSFRPIQQKHDTCLPSSIVAVLAGMGEDLSDDEISRSLTYDGTAPWRVGQWLKDKGIETKYFTASSGVIRRLLNAEMPFIMMLASESLSHAVAVIGIDEAADTLIIHDPASPHLREMLIERAGESERPLGPHCMLMAPRGDAKRLDLLGPEESEPAGAFQSYAMFVTERGVSACRRVVDELVKRHPGHPMTRYLQARIAVDTGDHTGGFKLMQELLKEFPKCMMIVRDLIHCCHSTGNTASLRKTLQEVVERGIVAGITENQSWQHPPTTYVCQYADQLKMSDDTRPEAERHLHRALIHDPYSCEPHHILGDLLCVDERSAESALPLLMSCCLSEENEHYARAYCDVLRRTGSEEDGLRFLERRVARLGWKPLGGKAWITWIGALEEFGRPDEACRRMKEALAAPAGNEAILAWSVSFWGRMGYLEEAREGLDRMRQKSKRADFLRASSAFYQRSGEWESALPMCEELTELEPYSISARGDLLELVARRDGRNAALALSKAWCDEWRDHDEFEQMYYEQLGLLCRTKEKDALLRKRVERNADDAWAWRELGHLLVDKLAATDPAENGSIKEDLANVRRECWRTSRNHPGTLGLEARSFEADGCLDKAVDYYLKAIEVDPTYGFGYERAWQCAASDPGIDLRRVWAKLEVLFLGTAGQLHNARQFALSIAGLYGLEEAEQVVLRWQARAKRDPTLIKAHADLLLNYGQGRTAAQKAADLLEKAVQEYPDHMELRFSLADAYADLLRHEDVVTVLEEILRREPPNGSARTRLARQLVLQGRKDDAKKVIEEGIRMNPLEQNLRYELSRLCRMAGDAEGSVQALVDSVAVMPESVFLREELCHELIRCGDPGRAVEEAREGVGVYPDGAYMWYLLGLCLDQCPWKREAGFVETKDAYQRALGFNVKLFDAAELLAILLCNNRMFGEAREILNKQLRLQTDKTPAKGRLAWVTHEEVGVRQAIDEIVDLLKARSDYRWGWLCLMDWLEEAKDWDRAREVLRELPSELLADAELRSRRLLVLESAGTPPDSLASEWDQLLYDFPMEEDLHLRRFDALWKRDKKDEAERVIAAIERFEAKSSFVRARRVDVLLDRGENDKAMETAVDVWCAMTEEGRWPDTHIWESLRDRNLERGGARAAIAALKHGRRMHVQAFAELANRIHKHQARGIRRWRWLRRMRGIDDVRTLPELLELVDSMPGENVDYRAAVLFTLAHFGRHATVISYWKKNLKRCREQTPVWQRVGYSMTQVNMRDARRHLACWREMPGVEMFIVYNYIMSLRSRSTRPRMKEDLGELYRSSRDALLRLRHDYTARATAAVLCEAAIRQNLDDEFLKYVDQFRAYLVDENKDGRLYEDSGQKNLPQAVLLLSSMIRSDNRQEIVELSEKCGRLSGLRQQSPWLRKIWLKRAKKKLTRKDYRKVHRKLRSL